MCEGELPVPTGSSKADRAEAWLQEQPVISVQVLNEVIQVCVRNFQMDRDEIGQVLELVRSVARSCC